MSKIFIIYEGEELAVENEKRQWQSKSQAMPRIPRTKGERGYLTSLIKLLNEVEKQTDVNNYISFSGSKSKQKLESYYIRLRPMKFLYQKTVNGNWEINEKINYNANDDNYNKKVATLLNDNIKYISEMLNFIQEPKNINEILDNANNEYFLTWKENSQIYDRLHWFMDLGMVDHIKYEKKYVVNRLGLEFLKKNPPVKKEEINKYKYDVTDEEVSIIVPEWILDFDNYDIEFDNIGYIPGGIKNATQTIVDVLEISRNYTTYSNIKEYLKENFDIASSSINGFITMLTKYDLLIRKNDITYKTSLLGEQLIDSDDKNLLLSFIFGLKTKFFFEMLIELMKKSMTMKELASLGVTKYKVSTDNAELYRKRISILKNAKLIIEDVKKTYTLTKRGRLFAEKIIKLFEVEDNIEESDKHDLSEQHNVYNLLQDLRLASVDSSNYKNFETLLNEFFKKLGFDTQLLAKPGTTDIILTAKTVPNYVYSVNVDAKTNRDGIITNNLIDFETLKEHKNKHNVDYVVVIGKEFEKGRLVDRAKNNKVTLFELDFLEELMSNHQKYPLQSIEYLPLFKQFGIASIDVLKDYYEIMKRRKELFKSIIKTLINNSDDEYSKGILSMDNIYFSIKDNEIFKDKVLEKKELESMLALLSNPLIDCVGSINNGKYYAKGSLEDAILKFGFYYNTDL